MSGAACAGPLKANAIGSRTRPARRIAASSVASGSSSASWLKAERNGALPGSASAFAADRAAARNAGGTDCSGSANSRSNTMAFAPARSSASNARANTRRLNGQRPIAARLRSSTMTSDTADPGGSGPRSRKRRSSEAVSRPRSTVLSPTVRNARTTAPAMTSASAPSRAPFGIYRQLLRVGAGDDGVELGLRPDARRNRIAPGLDARAPARRNRNRSLRRRAAEAHAAVEYAHLGALRLGEHEPVGRAHRRDAGRGIDLEARRLGGLRHDGAQQAGGERQLGVARLSCIGLDGHPRPRGGGDYRAVDHAQ